MHLLKIPSGEAFLKLFLMICITYILCGGGRGGLGVGDIGDLSEAHMNIDSNREPT